MALVGRCTSSSDAAADAGDRQPKSGLILRRLLFSRQRDMSTMSTRRDAIPLTFGILDANCSVQYTWKCLQWSSAVAKLHRLPSVVPGVIDSTRKSHPCASYRQRICRTGLKPARNVVGRPIPDVVRRFRGSSGVWTIMLFSFDFPLTILRTRSSVLGFAT